MTRGYSWVVDLLCVLAVTALAAVAVVLDFGWWFRAFLVVPLVVLAPGWALMAALFPATSKADSRTFDADRSGLTDPRSEKSGLDGVERLAFSTIASIAIVPLVGIAVHFSPVAITTTPVLLGVVLVVVACTAVGFVRRARLPANRRYELPLLAPVKGFFFDDSSGGIGGTETRATSFNVALALALLLFASSIGYAAVNPPPSERFTEFAVEVENVSEADTTMYPFEFTAGESRSVPFLLSNHETESVEYQVVVELQRLGGPNGNEVTDQSRVTTRSLSLEDGETREFAVEVTPSMEGQNVRLVGLTYVDSVPDNPTLDNAYRSVEMPINVTGA